MAKVHDLDVVLNNWAIWCSKGGVISQQKSIMQTIAESNGFVIRVPVGARSPNDTIESCVESAVSLLTQSGSIAALQADVLRIEYAAGWWNVSKRRNLKGFKPFNVTQTDCAFVLGISIRTYRRYLKAAREFVIEQLARSGYVVN